MTKYQKEREKQVAKLVKSLRAEVADNGRYWTPRNVICSNYLPDLERVYFPDGSFSERKFVPRSPNGYYETHRSAKGEVSGETIVKINAPSDALIAARKLAEDRAESLGAISVDDEMIFDALGQLALS